MSGKARSIGSRRKHREKNESQQKRKKRVRKSSREEVQRNALVVKFANQDIARTGFLLSIPVEVFASIVEQLDVRSYMNVAHTCKECYMQCLDPFLFQKCSVQGKWYREVFKSGSVGRLMFSKRAAGCIDSYRKAYFASVMQEEEVRLRNAQAALEEARERRNKCVQDCVDCFNCCCLCRSKYTDKFDITLFGCVTLPILVVTFVVCALIGAVIGDPIWPLVPLAIGTLWFLALSCSWICNPSDDIDEFSIPWLGCNTLCTNVALACAWALLVLYIVEEASNEYNLVLVLWVATPILWFMLTISWMAFVWVHCVFIFRDDD